MRTVLPLLVLGSVILFLPSTGDAREGGPGPQKPIWAPKGKTDRMLYDKACALQSRMWQHLSPEGLLIVRHRRGASGADLSHDALFRSDACMWTGCYMAAQACRWSVTRDPDALEQVRFLAKGMRALSDVTGTKGAFARNVGRPQTPGAGEKTIASPTGNGQRFRPDVSRDQLAGLTLGWTMVGTLMEDAALRALAAQQMRDIAIRIYQDKMWIRDHLGTMTEYGELRMNIKYAPFIRNGAQAAIGLAALIAAADLNPTDAAVARALRRLDQKGWDEALAHQNTQIAATVNSSNVHMIAIALAVIGRSAQRDGRPAHYAKKGMRALRRATVGWWNAGTCACFLLGQMPNDTPRLRGEIRATLHRLPAAEEPRTLVRVWRARRAAPIDQRQVSSWYWTNDVTLHHEWKPAAKLGPEVIWTGADWLFAYWLGRAAGEFTPLVGAGAKPREHHIPAERPVWTR